MLCPMRSWTVALPSSPRRFEKHIVGYDSHYSDRLEALSYVAQASSLLFSCIEGQAGSTVLRSTVLRSTGILPVILLGKAPPLLA